MFTPQQKVVLDGDLSLNLHLDGDLSLDLHMDGEAGTVLRVVERDAPTYTGQTTITPSEQPQVLSTNGKIVLTDITINPIPSKYGRIAWNGTALTVS